MQAVNNSYSRQYNDMDLCVYIIYTIYTGGIDIINNSMMYMFMCVYIHRGRNMLQCYIMCFILYAFPMCMYT